MKTIKDVRYTNRSARTLKVLIGDVNNTDNLTTIAPVKCSTVGITNEKMPKEGSLTMTQRGQQQVLFSAGYDKGINTHVLCNHRPVRVPMLTLSTTKSTCDRHVSFRTGTWINARRWPTEYTMGRRQVSRGSAILWAMSCWETLGPSIHVDVTLTCSTNLNYRPTTPLYCIRSP